MAGRTPLTPEIILRHPILGTTLVLAIIAVIGLAVSWLARSSTNDGRRGYRKGGDDPLGIAGQSDTADRSPGHADGHGSL